MGTIRYDGRTVEQLRVAECAQTRGDLSVTAANH